MLNKNVLLASAVLLSLGTGVSVSADEKAMTEIPVAEVAPVAETNVKTIEVAPNEDANTESETSDEDIDSEEVTDDEDIDDSDVSENEDMSDEDIDDDTSDDEDVTDKAGFSDEYNQKIRNWMKKFEALEKDGDKFQPKSVQEVQDGLDKFLFDVIDWHDEVEAYVDEHGVSDEAQALLDAFDKYMKNVEPILNAFEDLHRQLENGEITEEEFFTTMMMLLDPTLEDELDAEDSVEVPTKKHVEAPVQAKKTAETLPETGSNQTSFLSVIGAALAGLTIFGFGFKKRG